MNLWRALQIAYDAHDGVKDKGGSPYFLHPVFVSEFLETEDEKIAAVLHDVVEDTDITLDMLREEGFSEAVIEAIDCVTKRDGEDYMDFVRRAASNPIAKAVKIADIQNNLDLSRIPNPTAWDFERLEKYRKALRFLKGAEE